MNKILFKNVNKMYEKDVKAVSDFSMDITGKEFIVLVGPSGCGKSTTLRMIAGLEDITSGELYINGKIMNNVPSKDRDIAMVFQDYALFPHMTVYQNIAFGLIVAKEDKGLIESRVLEVAKQLQLTDYLERKPRNLSGGQRQRVALGRCMVMDSSVFLMDEPLSNLDAKLRVHMRSQIVELHKNLGVTTIYVTHDQIEAMTMATRIVVLNEGVIQQVGTPEEIYDMPANMFVASFIGSPAMNFIRGRIEQDKFISGDYKLDLHKNILDSVKKYDGKDIILGVRPEDIIYDNDLTKNIKNKFKACVEVSELLGRERNVHTTINGLKVIAKVLAAEKIKTGDTIELSLDMEKIHFFDPETEEVI